MSNYIISRFRTAGLRLSGEFGWMVLGNVLAMGGSLLGIRVLTEFLPPNQFGHLYLLLTFPTFIQSVIFAPVGGSSARFWSISEENSGRREFWETFRRFLILASIATFFLGAIAWISFEFLQSMISVGALLALLIFSVTSSSISSLTGVLNAARKRKNVTLYKVTEQFARYMCAVIAILIIGATFEAALFGFAVAYVALLIFCWTGTSGLRAHQHETKEGQEHYGLAMFRYGWPFFIWGVFYWLQNASDRWALEIFMSTREVGLYSALYQIGYLPMLLVCSLGAQFAQPIIFANASRSEPGGAVNAWYMTKALAITCLSITCGVSLGVFFIHDFLFALFVAPEYLEVSNLLPLSLLAGGLYSTAQGVELFLLSGKSTSRLLPIKITTSVIGAVGSFVGAHMGGIVGVAISTVIASLIFFLWMCILAFNERRRVGI